MAQQLGITQSAVSQLLNTLEKRMDSPQHQPAKPPGIAR
ncbi:hypothetical protein OE903_01900 [Bacillus sp. B6(2022)]|nr:hypothetical protein [Bacillus sp. B6(2022)]